MNTNFYNIVKEITSKDNRFSADAYEFVMQALWFAQKKIKREGHMTARELLDGIRDFGLEQYGPMTKMVFNHWGLRETRDFGEVVFNMIDSGLMGKTESDTREDFNNVFDFEEALNAFQIKKVKKPCHCEPSKRAKQSKIQK